MKEDLSSRPEQQIKRKALLETYNNILGAFAGTSAASSTGAYDPKGVAASTVEAFLDNYKVPGKKLTLSTEQKKGIAVGLVKAVKDLHDLVKGKPAPKPAETEEDRQAFIKHYEQFSFEKLEAEFKKLEAEFEKLKQAKFEKLKQAKSEKFEQEEFEKLKAEFEKLEQAEFKKLEQAKSIVTSFSKAADAIVTQGKLEEKPTLAAKPKAKLTFVDKIKQRISDYKQPSIIAGIIHKGIQKEDTCVLTTMQKKQVVALLEPVIKLKAIAQQAEASKEGLAAKESKIPELNLTAKEADKLVKSLKKELEGLGKELQMREKGPTPGKEPPFKGTKEDLTKTIQQKQKAIKQLEDKASECRKEATLLKNEVQADKAAISQGRTAGAKAESMMREINGKLSKLLPNEEDRQSVLGQVRKALETAADRKMDKLIPAKAPGNSMTR